MEFRILGPLEVWNEDHQVPLRGNKQRGLLVILLLHANQVVSADRLIDDLWGAEPPEAGTTALRVRISQLRKSLGAGRTAVVTQAPGYVLRIDREQLDLCRFEQLVADASCEPPESAAERLREALALWRGSALAEFAYDDFAQTAIRRLEELRLIALEKRIEADLALGRHREVVGELETLTSEHPLRETPVRQLMLALYRSGRQADALAVYRASRARLLDELGLEPAPEVQALERAILKHDPGLELAPPPAPERSILVAPLDPAHFDDLLVVAEPLARHPPRELILAHLIGSARELPQASALARERREALHARGITARAAAFTTEQPGTDLIRIANEQDVDLILLDAPSALLDDPTVRAALLAAPCDVGVLASRDRRVGPGPLLVPFAGAEHDWSAIELAAWIARSEGVPLRLAGPLEAARDSSRLLASASLAVQRALGVQAEPLLVEPGGGGLLAAAARCSLVVLGLSDRWKREGLGPVRTELIRDAGPPVLLVRRGLRPGGLSPPEGLTRFTWSIAAR
jgi:DNA-binding SARP family transcriptional activator